MQLYKTYKTVVPGELRNGTVNTSPFRKGILLMYYKEKDRI